MSDLTGDPARPGDNLAVDEQGAPDPGTDGDHREGLGTDTGAEPLLSHRQRTDIVLQVDGKTGGGGNLADERNPPPAQERRISYDPVLRIDVPADGHPEPAETAAIHRRLLQQIPDCSRQVSDHVADLAGDQRPVAHGTDGRFEISHHPDELVRSDLDPGEETTLGAHTHR